MIYVGINIAKLDPFVSVISSDSEILLIHFSSLITLMASICWSPDSIP